MRTMLRRAQSLSEVASVRGLPSRALHCFTWAIAAFGLLAVSSDMARAQERTLSVENRTYRFHFSHQLEFVGRTSDEEDGPMMHLWFFNNILDPVSLVFIEYHKEYNDVLKEYEVSRSRDKYHEREEDFVDNSGKSNMLFAKSACPHECTVVVWISYKNTHSALGQKIIHQFRDDLARNEFLTLTD